MNGREFISIFTPSRTNPAHLEFILVQRRKLLEDAVERVWESVLTGHKHHLLFVGPRGCGKSHLVTLIVHRLSQKDNDSGPMRIAWLNEDQTCTTLLELFIRVYSALEKRYPDEYSADALDPAYGMNPNEAREFVAQHLLASLGSRTLVVVIENLDALFDGLGDAGQKQLRAFIQEHPKFSLVATAQRLGDNLAKRVSPFFGFFQIEHLKPLNVREAAELLRKIAELNRQDDVAAFLDTARGRSRVRALHHLSGGNHRIYIVLSQFISRDSIDALVGPFTKMVDELTPYYQERLRWLPAQQRKIVEFLCGANGTVPVKELARRLFATQQTISSQLQDLREKGYVKANQKGRESLYEISEPLMRICVEIKENQRYEPLRLLVDFLRVWYEGTDLDTRLGSTEMGSPHRAYLEAAIFRNTADGNLRKQLMLNELKSKLGENFPSIDCDRILRQCEALSESFALALANFVDGEQSESSECLGDGTESEMDVPEKAHLGQIRAVLHAAAGDHQKAIADYTAVIGLTGAPVEQVARALVNRGVAYRRAGENQKALEDCTAVIGLAGAPVVQVVRALISRGFIYGQAGDNQKAIDDYTAVIGRAGAPVAQVARALFMRAVIYAQAGDNQKAIDDYSSVIGLAGAAVEPVASALVYRGVTYGQAGDNQKAIDDYTAVVKLTGAPAEQIAMALVYRGVTYGQAGDTQKAIEDYTTVVKLAEAPVEQVSMALFFRGVTYGQAGDTQKAIDDYISVIGLAGAPVEQVSMALLNRGFTHGHAGDTQKAIEDYTAVIGLAGAPVEQVAVALLNRGFTCLQIGQMDSSRRDFASILNLPGLPLHHAVDAALALAVVHFTDGHWSEGFDAVTTGLEYGAKTTPPYSGDSVDLVGVIFAGGLGLKSRSEKIGKLLALYRTHGALIRLGDGLLKHLGKVFLAGGTLPSADNLEQWASAWEESAKTIEEFRLPLRLLRTGIDFLKTGGKDQTILLSLTQPEREILRQAFGLDLEG